MVPFRATYLSTQKSLMNNEQNFGPAHWTIFELLFYSRVFYEFFPGIHTWITYTHIVIHKRDTRHFLYTFTFMFNVFFFLFYYTFFFFRWRNFFAAATEGGGSWLLRFFVKHSSRAVRTWPWNFVSYRPIVARIPFRKHNNWLFCSRVVVIVFI